MADKVPRELQDVCKYCGDKRTFTQGNNSNPRCPRQGCPGQHTK